MKYVEKITLSKKETDQAERLAQLVHEKDGTYSDIYLNNQYNYFADMPTFVLAYHEDELVGLTMLYADDAPNEGVDIHLEVAPSMRRRKIAQAMLARAYKILSRYGYEQFYYVCEQGFLDLNPQFLANVKLEVDDAEYNMCCTAPAPIAHDDELDQALTVRTLSPADVDEVAAMHSQAFGENPASSRKYIAQGLEDKDACSFVLVCQDKIAGYCAVDVGTYDYFFGLFVVKELRGHGFATYFIKKMMKKRQQQGASKFVLDVEADNRAAIHAYQNAGFEFRGKTVYLVKKD